MKQKQPPTLYLDPWCWYHCYDKFASGQPRQATDNAHCQCIMPGCEHGQEMMPRKIEVMQR